MTGMKTIIMMDFAIATASTGMYWPARYFVRIGVTRGASRVDTAVIATERHILKFKNSITSSMNRGWRF